jgi:hypothetical protein
MSIVRSKRYLDFDGADAKLTQQMFGEVTGAWLHRSA